MHAVTISQDSVWEGDILLDESVVVQKGVTLIVRPGARIKFKPG